MVDVSSLNWSSFWDLADPEQTAHELTALHGAEASAAACCALTAYSDGREEDYRFWKAVFYELQSREKAEPDSIAGASLN